MSSTPLKAKAHPTHAPINLASLREAAEVSTQENFRDFRGWTLNCQPKPSTHS